MKLLLFIMSLAAVAVGAVKQLSPDELAKLLEKKDNLFFLDVREPEEIERYGSLPGYVNIPLGQLEKRLNEVPKDKLIVTACQRGGRAGKAAELLEARGYKVVGACGLEGYTGKREFPKDKR
jgi:rhodanese-related sulfurtransferase